jgi:O-antigen biosynthesis protein
MTLLEGSVIVPSYNSGRTVLRCLQALQNQETGYSYEVIVVDSSNDGSGALIESHFPAVKLIRIAERTLPGAARNIGIETARGRILAFTDADCVVESHWLNKILQAHREESCGAVGGAVLNGLPLNPIAWSGYLLEFNEQLPNLPRRFVDFLPTCNVSFKRSVFERYGVFPTDVWPSEDSIFAWHLSRAGERFLFDPGIRVKHIFRPHFRSFMDHQVRLGKASADARRRVPLPHAWAANHPLRWFVPFVRLARIEGRLARSDLPNFLRFNLLLPLSLSGLCAWGVGFAKESRSD